MKINALTLTAIAIGVAWFPLGADAQTSSGVQESFNGSSLSNPVWLYYGPPNAGSHTGSQLNGGGACLTAGSYSTPTSGNLPGCTNDPYYSNTTLTGGYSSSSALSTTPDPTGHGALRLTNGATANHDYGGNEAGAILYNTTFPTTQGILITFNSVTYGGDNGNNTGADGMSFFLTDPSSYGSGGFTLGSWGGALGYACSEDSNNNPYFGVSGGYVGIGIDEYGNFEKADGTETGLQQSASNGNYTATYTPNSLTVRGAGNVSLASMTAAFNAQGYSDTTHPAVPYYGSTVANAISSNGYAAVSNTCKNGYLTDSNGNAVTPAAGGHTKYTMAAYPLIKSVTLTNSSGGSNPISNQQSTSHAVRGSAIPISYTVSIDTNAVLNFSYSYNGGLQQNLIVNYQLPALPANGYGFGFAGSTGGYDNIHEITCFKALPNSSSGTSSSGNVQENARVQGGEQVYLATYNPSYWSGSVQAVLLEVNSNDNSVSLNQTCNSSGVCTLNPQWDAGCVLTGGNCSTTGVNGMTAQGPSARTILVANGAGSNSTTAVSSSAGVPFEWSSLSSTQQALLGNATTGPLVLNYLRGDTTNQVPPTGTTPTSTQIYRARKSILADVIHSSPTWVGPPLAPYGIFSDQLYPNAATPPENTAQTGYASSYAYFASDGQQGLRTNVVYVGANDGMLHGFRAGQYINGQFNTDNNATADDGLEMIAYIPNLALNTITSSYGNLNFTMPSYSHNAFVDATPGTGDLYYNGGWHTWLAGGLGGGGNIGGEVDAPATGATTPVTQAGDFYILEVTAPSTPSGTTESSAAGNVIGDWYAVPGTSSHNLTCTSATDNGASTCYKHLGAIYGSPVIRRLHDGNWAAIVGNGLDSATGTAGIFIFEVNVSSGALSIRYLDTGSGRITDPVTSATTNNGIAAVVAADLDGDHITDYIYAGDVLGNLWRFDLTSNTASNWGVSNTFLLYTVPQTTSLSPITTEVFPFLDSSGGTNRIVVAFATGRQYPQTSSNPATYATGTQGVYAIWDWNLSNWNTLNTSVTYYSLSTAPTQSLVTQTLSTGSAITVNGQSVSTLVVTNNSVCWKGSTSCGSSASSNTNTGWQVMFPGSSEQAVYNPVAEYGVFLVNTTIPGYIDFFACSNQPASGNTIALNLNNGGGTTLFSSSTNSNGQSVAGLGLSAVGTPVFVTLNAATSTGNTNIQTYMINQTQSGTGTGSGASATQICTPGASGCNCAAGQACATSNSPGVNSGGYNGGGPNNGGGNNNSNRITWTELR